MQALTATPSTLYAALEGHGVFKSEKLQEKQFELTYLPLNLIIILSCSIYLLTSCQQNKQCLQRIEKVRNSVSSNIEQYDSIATIFNSIGMDMDTEYPQSVHDSLFSNNKTYKRLIEQLGVRTVTIPPNGYGQLALSSSLDNCDYIYSEVSIIYSKILQPTISNTRMKLDSIVPHWYLYTVSH